MNCLNCNKELTKKQRKNTFCSRLCWIKHNEIIRPIVKCLNCGKEFKPFPADIKRGKAKFCSHICSVDYDKKTHSVEKTCKGCGKSFIVKTYRQFDYCSHSCFLKVVNPFKHLFGENHPNWKGGNGKVGREHSPELLKWRKKILKRDKNKCVLCNSTVRLEVDHLWSYSIFPELRFKMWNGRVLCHNCHKKTTNYGFKDYHFMEDFRKTFGIPTIKTPTPEKILRIKNLVIKQHPEILGERLL